MELKGLQTKVIYTIHKHTKEKHLLPNIYILYVREVQLKLSKENFETWISID